MGLRSFLKNLFGKKAENLEDDQPVSSGGLVVVASTEEPKKREKFFDCVEERIEELGDVKVLYLPCRHILSVRGKVHFCGQIFDFDNVSVVQKKLFALNEVKEAGRCGICFLDHLHRYSIRCCFCGAPIMAGSGVALYHKSSGGINMEKATFVEDNAIGCLNFDCLPSGGFYAGWWTVNGFKSAFDGASCLADKVAKEDKAIVANV